MSANRNGPAIYQDGPLSMASVQAMSEHQLRTQVLIPLFRAMGYLDVLDHHGGVLEQGKDIVMWERTPLGRSNIAVVVKAKRISGQASGSGSAGEVCDQIRQSFGRSFEDGSALEDQTVHECIVVCPHEIKSEARHSIKSNLDEHLSRHVRFLHGHELWLRIQEYLGPRGALAQLRAVGKVLEDASPNYRIVARTAGAQLAVSVEAKRPEAVTEEPLDIKGTFAFPDDDSGRATMSALVRHFETGSPVRVAGEHIKEFVLPPLLQQMFGNEVGEIAMESRPSQTPVPLTIEFAGKDGQSATLQDLEFRCVQKGISEATIVAKRNPYKVSIVLHDADKRAMVTIATELDGANVTQALEAVRLRRLLAGGASVIVRDASTRLNISVSDVAPGAVVPYEDEIEALLEDLVTIQGLTRCPIPVPTREFTRGDLITARGIATGLRTGVVPITVSDFTATMTRRGVEQVIRAAEAASLRMAVVREETACLLETEIPLGPVARIVVGASLQPDERARLVAALHDETRDDFEVKVDCSGATSTAVYLNCVPTEERARYRAMFPGFDQSDR